MPAWHGRLKGPNKFESQAPSRDSHPQGPWGVCVLAGEPSLARQPGTEGRMASERGEGGRAQRTHDVRCILSNRTREVRTFLDGSTEPSRNRHRANTLGMGVGARQGWHCRRRLRQHRLLKGPRPSRIESSIAPAFVTQRQSIQSVGMGDLNLRAGWARSCHGRPTDPPSQCTRAR